MEHALVMKDIVKTFPGTVAVNHVSFDVKKGEVHALCGENGAGKSTLMKIIAGENGEYEGQVWIDDKQVALNTPQKAKENGIEIIHQELSLAQSISIAENILVGRLPKKGFMLNSKALIEKSAYYLKMVGLENINPTRLVSSLSQHEAQLVEIAKALSNHPKILIMDEPTSALSREEVKRLFAIIDDLKKNGLAIIYISHFLNEVFEVSDRITVMRDGKHEGTFNKSETTPGEIIHMMVGRDVDVFYSATQSNVGEEILRVQNLTRYGFFHDISFSVSRGEVVGICGLTGAGRSEIAKSMCGLDPLDKGEIYLLGQKIEIRNYQDCIKQGIAYLPEDRKKQGLQLDFSMADNITSALIIAQSKNTWINKRKYDSNVKNLIETLKIVPNQPQKVVKTFSGGNQQKVLLAKLMAIKPKLLILDEPTRGVDVGAKEMIHNAVREYASKGNAVMLISSDMMELSGLSDRVLIVNQGRIAGTMDRTECTEESLLMAANGGVNKND
jgi:ABC-type sugar transport system, ATPase component